MELPENFFFHVFSVVLAISSYILLQKRRSKLSGINRMVGGEKPEWKVLHLLPEERVRLMNTPSISTVTFYKGKFPIDTLRQRLDVIVRLNPFLLGRFINVTEFDVLQADKSLGLSVGVTAVYPISPDTQQEHVSYFEVVRGVKISADMPYEELLRRVQEYNVPLGKYSIDKDKPMFKVTLFEIVPDEQYCMMFSLSHAIGDGFTFYKLYGMLNPTSPVIKLDPTRKTELFEDGKRSIQFGSSLRDLPFVLLGTLNNKFLQPRIEARIHFVSTSEVQAEKQAYKSLKKSEYISTNDVLTAWFFRFTQAALGFMVANFRGRLPNVTDDLAGNYHGRVVYSTDIMKQPGGIRESVLNLQNFMTAKPTLSQLTALNLALVTNWSSFYSDAKFSGCEQVIHLPVMDVSTSVVRQCMLVFQARRGVLGVILWTRGIPQSRFDQEKMLSSEQIN